LQKTLNIAKSSKKCIRSLYVLEWPLNGEEDDDFKITFANLPMVKGQFEAKMRPFKLENFDEKNLHLRQKKWEYILV
jgi:hypothetical protein